MSLNVMVLESEYGAADEARAELVEAGHVVSQCHDRGQPTFPCRGIVDAASCPLNSHTVDLALVVRSRVRSQPAPSEDGVCCALMKHVPLVVADCIGAHRAASARVSVTRRSGGLRVRVTGLDEATRQERQTAVVRIVGALRRLDRAARTIDAVTDNAG
jgi:hypothetical protein